MGAQCWKDAIVMLDQPLEINTTFDFCYLTCLLQYPEPLVQLCLKQRKPERNALLCKVSSTQKPRHLRRPSV